MALGCVRVVQKARLERDGRVEQANAKGVILSTHKSQARFTSALNAQLDPTLAVLEEQANCGSI